MKKAGLAVCVVILGVLFCSMSLAEEMAGMPGMVPKDMHGAGAGMMGKRMGGGCPMGGGMMNNMLERKVVATSDGGVVVLTLNKITKYDKDLNVVKEVEIKTDMDAIQQEMMGMMKFCPMMKGGSPQEGPEGDEFHKRPPVMPEMK